MFILSPGFFFSKKTSAGDLDRDMQYWLLQMIRQLAALPFDDSV
jgi:hypothetical protein